MIEKSTKVNDLEKAPRGPFFDLTTSTIRDGNFYLKLIFFAPDQR